MTAQLSDTFVWRGREYALAEAEGGPLFDPADHGLEVRMISTACWRGFVCRYGVDDEQLVLTALSVGMDEPPAELFGASWDDGFLGYRPIRVKVPFTGRMLIGDDFLPEWYVHAGFHPAWKYREVHELEFASGRLTGHRDRSAELSQVRASKPPIRPPRHS
jgi:hypothetical protein